MSAVERKDEELTAQWALIMEVFPFLPTTTFSTFPGVVIPELTDADKHDDESKFAFQNRRAGIATQNQELRKAQEVWMANNGEDFLQAVKDATKDKSRKGKGKATSSSNPAQVSASRGSAKMPPPPPPPPPPSAPTPTPRATRSSRKRGRSDSESELPASKRGSVSEDHLSVSRGTRSHKAPAKAAVVKEEEPTLQENPCTRCEADGSACWRFYRRICVRCSAEKLECSFRRPRNRISGGRARATTRTAPRTTTSSSDELSDAITNIAETLTRINDGIRLHNAMFAVQNDWLQPDAPFLALVESHRQAYAGSAPRRVGTGAHTRAGESPVPESQNGREDDELEEDDERDDDGQEDRVPDVDEGDEHKEPDDDEGDEHNEPDNDGDDEHNEQDNDDDEDSERGDAQGSGHGKSRRVSHNFTPPPFAAVTYSSVKALPVETTILAPDMKQWQSTPSRARFCRSKATK
ncbi:hypothetical protein CYLTODRAFT_458709 [Cylindrobasidium torrendii FP15055 ss-10]|uniref:Uncharacterized protein n=1 Tax=Cylindrobasidium torrendii FP15055 ss-10 TaxID=1314674 RepID=A0A0D7AWM2_9AGAR|nr:hypothetical protein CYLTODRAFT_458709 [Cylindrobasidium torrendii FP15055 ss-10]